MSGKDLFLGYVKAYNSKDVIGSITRLPTHMKANT